MTVARKRSHTRKASDVLPAVRPIAERLAAAHGLFLWDVVFVREAGRETLRVACDREGGVESGELSALAEDLGREIDHADAVPGDTPYVLEVTSPGAERKVSTPEQFATCRGRRVRIAFSDGRDPLEGTILDAADNVLRIQITTDEEAHVPYDLIAEARLRVEGIG